MGNCASMNLESNGALVIEHVVSARNKRIEAAKAKARELKAAATDDLFDKSPRKSASLSELSQPEKLTPKYRTPPTSADSLSLQLRRSSPPQAKPIQDILALMALTHSDPHGKMPGSAMPRAKATQDQHRPVRAYSADSMPGSLVVTKHRPLSAAARQTARTDTDAPPSRARGRPRPQSAVLASHPPAAAPATPPQRAGLPARRPQSAVVLRPRPASCSD